jgi:hypothetical protein
MEQAKASQYVKEHRDSAEAVVLRRDTAPIARSTDTGAITRTTADIPVNAILDSYSNYEIVASQNADAGTAIQPADVRCKIAAKDLGLTIEPTPQDRVLRADGSLWTVVAAKQDKHFAWWFLQLRRP